MGKAFLYDGNKNYAENRREKDGVVYYIRGVTKVAGKRYERYAIHTHFIGRDEDLLENINKYVKPLYKEGDILAIGHKVVSMCQDNTVERKNVKPGLIAKTLSKFAEHTISGGMEEPYKLQVVIDLKGLGLVLFAAICSGIAKFFGKKGIFYQILGKEIACMDGFDSDSLFDIYRDLAILYPENPDQICMELQEKAGIDAMIIDANDITMDVLAASENILTLGIDILSEMVSDNPEGQDDELTPFIIIRNIKNNPAEPFVPMRPRNAVK